MHQAQPPHHLPETVQPVKPELYPAHLDAADVRVHAVASLKTCPELYSCIGRVFVVVFVL